MVETAAPPRPAERLERSAGFDGDCVLWTPHQAALVRAGRFNLLDWENVAEQIESLGIGDRRELYGPLEVLIHRSPSWRSAICNQRGRIERVLKGSPGLRHEVAALSREEYGAAREAASSETGCALRTFPKSLP